MKIKKLKLKNFKQFKSQTFDFNDDINIIVGDNESGKSSVLEAIEICTNCSIRGKALSSELTTFLFNNQSIKDYLAGNKSQETLPEVLIEVYLEGNPELKGTNNSENEDCEGLSVKISFDTDLGDAYEAFIKEPQKINTIPIELYKVEWFSFAWNRITHYNKGIVSLLIDPTRIHPTFGRTKYINSILDAAITKQARSTLNLNYRQLRAEFDQKSEVIAINAKLDEDKSISSKDLKVTADLGTASSWESGLQLTVDDVVFDQIGKGEQNQIQIKLALKNKAGDVQIIMLEEPENHLSHINLARLVNYIEEKHKGKQIFISTHSSYVLNKLNVNNLCLLHNGYVRLKNIETKTVKTLRRLPGYDTLRVVLSKKVILVEGPSDELILRKIYQANHDCQPEHHGIDLIVVRGLGFKNYLNIAKHLKNPIHVVKDNDGNYNRNIERWGEKYSEYGHIKFFSPSDNKQYSLEPALVEANSSGASKLDKLAKAMFSTRIYNCYLQSNDLAEKKKFICDWFKGSDTGSRKVDSAMRLFDRTSTIEYPKYLIEATNFE